VRDGRSARTSAEDDDVEMISHGHRHDAWCSMTAIRRNCSTTFGG
jgi:hypothetical protein